MWKTLMTPSRYLGAEGIQATGMAAGHRNEFHKDYDRVIFSNAFRRLSRKTQVHPLSRNDHVHNRLTHSLEVASVGRSLGLKAGAFLRDRFDPEMDLHDIAYTVQTACLAHDIGNPPFGHAGEEVIKEWFQQEPHQCYLDGLTPVQISDLQRLDGNAQSFRIVTQLENHLMDGGMRLLLPTLGCLVKYPYSSLQCAATGKDKFNYFDSEAGVFQQIFAAMGLRNGDGSFRRHPLSYLMEAADDICYGMLDLQDAAELKLLTEHDIAGVFGTRWDNTRSLPGNVALTIHALTEMVGQTFEAEWEVLLSPEQPKDLLALCRDAELTDILSRSKTLARDKIFNDKRKIELELGAYQILGTLLGCLIPAVAEYHRNGCLQGLSFRHKRALELMGNECPQASDSLYEKYRRVIDYLVGMTDNYAQFTANQLNGVAE